jgi:hypothetical protein
MEYVSSIERLSKKSKNSDFSNFACNEIDYLQASIFQFWGFSTVSGDICNFEIRIYLSLPEDIRNNLRLPNLTPMHLRRRIPESFCEIFQDHLLNRPSKIVLI